MMTDNDTNVKQDFRELKRRSSTPWNFPALLAVLIVTNASCVDNTKSREVSFDVTTGSISKPGCEQILKLDAKPRSPKMFGLSLVVSSSGLEGGDTTVNQSNAIVIDEELTGVNKSFEAEVCIKWINHFCYTPNSAWEYEDLPKPSKTSVSKVFLALNTSGFKRQDGSINDMIESGSTWFGGRSGFGNFVMQATEITQFAGKRHYFDHVVAQSIVTQSKLKFHYVDQIRFKHQGVYVLRSQWIGKIADQDIDLVSDPIVIDVQCFQEGKK